MSRVISTKTGQRLPNMVSQLGGELCDFEHVENVSSREMRILLMLLKKKTNHRE